MLSGTISYIYTATGIKLKKIVSTGTTTSYAGNYVYENGALQFFNQPEGYVEPVSAGSTNFAYVYQYKDHLGNVRLSYSDSNGDGVITPTGLGAEIREENNYYPFGLKHKGYNNVQNGRDHKFGFGNKEEQDELGLSWIDITARNYDPALGRWMNIDPLAHEFPHMSPYVAFADNPIRYIDEDGRAPGDPIGAGYYAGSMNGRTIGFIVRHPYIAAQIGSVAPGSTNISTNAVRFATRLGLNENAAHEGSQVNAFRHTLWQASITTEFGESVAKQIGNAHEDNPFVDLKARTFTGKNALSQADQTIDLLNNQIGRQLGKDNPNATPQELAAKTLDYQYNTGLYTATTNKDGSISATQTKITEQQYKTGLETIKGLNNSGFTAPEQKSRDDAAAKEIKQLDAGPKN